MTADRREILEYSVKVDEDYAYCEGHSPVVDANEGGGTWFCFEVEKQLADAELRKLGFTIEEIDTARRRDS